MELRGRTALVTGAAKRLGRAFALALADSGADVILHYGRSAAEAEKTAEEARAKGVKAWTLQADLANVEASGRLVREAVDRTAAPDLLVNSASIFKPGTLADTTRENWTEHLDVNLRAPFLLMQEFARATGDRPAKIVNIADWRALHPGRAYLAYTVSKAGLLTLTQIAARELAPRVQVNALALGAVLPPPGGEAELARVVKKVPAGRPARIEEVTDALLFLLRNDFLTGETLFLDGGAHLVQG